MQDPLSPKQWQFIANSTKRWNLAHGAVSTGKTICTAFRFFQAIDKCPDSEIAMIGKTSTTIFNNVINLLFESKELCIFRPFFTWYASKRELKYKDKTITTYGAKDEGSVGLIQGRSLSLAYCDEMTLYPESFIHMLDTRLRKPHSMGFAAMNPSHPNHIVKKWIDHAIAGHPKYYHLHFVLDDNPYLPPDYKETIGSSLSGIFYKRNFLGLWCLAEGAIFDFFEKEIHVAERPPEAAEYWIAGIDFGLNNPFAAVLIGVSTGRFNQTGRHWWVEQEFYWDFKKQNEPKTVSDLARDVYNFLEPYAVRAVYLDPSALVMKNDLSRLGIYTAETNNEVEEGIAITANEIRQGRLTILKHCKNLIKEIEGYVWDPKQAEKGYDAPLKQHDHLIDATRYCVASHKIPEYKPYKEGHDPDSYRQGRFSPGKRKF